MEFGIFLPYQVNSEGEEMETIYDRMLELAITADRAGAGYIWTPEHRYIHLLPSPSSLIPAVQIAQHVTCRVGTAVVVLPYHNPLQLAGDIAAADQTMGGRLELGVARGAYRHEFEALHLDFSRSKEHFAEVLESLELLFKNEDSGSSMDGEFVQFEDVYIWPRPRQRPHPPIWIGAQSLPSIEDAARRGYDVMHSLMLWDENHLSDVVQAFQTGRDESGRSDTRFAVTRFASIVESEEEVDEVIDSLLHGWRIHMRLHDYTDNADGRGVVTSKPHPSEPSRDLMKRNLLIGTKQQVMDRVGEYAELGVDILNLNVSTGLSHEKTLEGLSQFGDIFKEFATNEPRNPQHAPV